VLAAAVLATGCRADVLVTVDVAADGSGRVEAAVGLDHAALARLGDLPSQLRVDDLRQAGWDVSAPARQSDGLTWVRATRRFGTPDEAARVFTELTGPEGPFRELHVTQERALFRTTTRLAAVVDLTAGVEGFSDPRLRELLGGSPFGVDRAELERQLGAPLDQVVKVRVTARLPGAVDANAPFQLGGTAEWRPEVGSQTLLAASSSAWNTRPLALAAASAAVALLLVGILARRLVRRRLARRHSTAA
jgi:hypothetical protein